MSSEILLLVEAINQQTQAINRMAESNQQIVSILLEPEVVEEKEDDEFEYDLSGNRING